MGVRLTLWNQNSRRRTYLLWRRLVAHRTHQARLWLALPSSPTTTSLWRLHPAFCLLRHVRHLPHRQRLYRCLQLHLKRYLMLTLPTRRFNQTPAIPSLSNNSTISIMTLTSYLQSLRRILQLPVSLAVSLTPSSFIASLVAAGFAISAIWSVFCAG